MFRVNTRLVRAEIFKRGLSTSQFAKQAALNEITARKLLQSDDVRVQPKVVGAVAKFLGVDGEELILLKE